MHAPIIIPNVSTPIPLLFHISFCPILTTSVHLHIFIRYMHHANQRSSFIAIYRPYLANSFLVHSQLLLPLPQTLHPTTTSIIPGQPYSPAQSIASTRKNLKETHLDFRLQRRVSQLSLKRRRNQLGPLALESLQDNLNIDLRARERWTVEFKISYQCHDLLL